MRERLSLCPYLLVVKTMTYPSCYPSVPLHSCVHLAVADDYYTRKEARPGGKARSANGGWSGVASPGEATTTMRTQRVSFQTHWTEQLPLLHFNACVREAGYKLRYAAGFNVNTLHSDTLGKSRMQLVSENKDSFDCLAASSLFWDVLPVQTRRPDRDDGLEQLTFRLLLGNSGHLNCMRAVRMYIYSEADFHELYTLDITEVDFQTLKSDQGILVDFSKFAEKVVDLLRKCIDAKCEELPTFKAVLDFFNGEWLLKLVETNDFKQIPHITLAFRRGNSHAVHCFLALRATELKLDRDRLKGNLTQEQEELGKARKLVAEYFQKLQMIESIHTEKKLVYAGQIKELQVSTHCELVKQREDLVFAYERCEDIRYQRKSIMAWLQSSTQID